MFLLKFPTQFIYPVAHDVSVQLIKWEEHLKSKLNLKKVFYFAVKLVPHLL